MCYLTVDKDGTEVIWVKNKPQRRSVDWGVDSNYAILPTGSIRKLVGKKITWENDPIEL